MYLFFLIKPPSDSVVDFFIVYARFKPKPLNYIEYTIFAGTSPRVFLLIAILYLCLFCEVLCTKAKYF